MTGPTKEDQMSRWEAWKREVTAMILAFLLAIPLIAIVNIAIENIASR